MGNFPQGSISIHQMLVAINEERQHYKRDFYRQCYSKYPQAFSRVSIMMQAKPF